MGCSNLRRVTSFRRFFIINSRSQTKKKKFLHAFLVSFFPTLSPVIFIDILEEKHDFEVEFQFNLVLWQEIKYSLVLHSQGE